VQLWEKQALAPASYFERLHCSFLHSSYAQPVLQPVFGLVFEEQRSFLDLPLDSLERMS
jgi:hypothetical protein